MDVLPKFKRMLYSLTNHLPHEQHSNLKDSVAIPSRQNVFLALSFFSTFLTCFPMIFEKSLKIYFSGKARVYYKLLVFLLDWLSFQFFSSISCTPNFSQRISFMYHSLNLTSQLFNFSPFWYFLKKNSLTIMCHKLSVILHPPLSPSLIHEPVSRLYR